MDYPENKTSGSVTSKIFLPVMYRRNDPLSLALSFHPAICRLFYATFDTPIYFTFIGLLFLFSSFSPILYFVHSFWIFLRQIKVAMYVFFA